MYWELKVKLVECKSVPPKNLYVFKTKKRSILRLLSRVEQSSNVRYFHWCVLGQLKVRILIPQGQSSQVMYAHYTLMYRELKVKLVEWK